MKEITLHISDYVLNEIYSTLMVRKLNGAFYGICDEALDKIVKAIKSDNTEIQLISRKEKLHNSVDIK